MLKWGYNFLLIVLIACNINVDKDKKIATDKVKFSTSDASELFFKNIRQTSYDKEEQIDTKLEIYRNRERSKLKDIPVLNLAIVLNWRFDEAYILVEPNEYLSNMETLSILWKDPANNQSGNYIFLPGNKDSHFQFAAEIYKSVLSGHELFVKTEKGNQQLFQKKHYKEVFRKTMLDYYRLVDLV